MPTQKVHIKRDHNFDPRNRAQLNSNEHVKEFIRKMKRESYVVDIIIASSKKHGNMVGVEASDKVAAKQIVHAITYRPELFLAFIKELVRVRNLMDKKPKKKRV